MNLGIFGIWIVVILLIFILIFIVFLYCNRWSEETDVIFAKPSTACTISSSSVPNISGRPCCYVGTTPTASKYIPDIDLVVNPVAIPYLSVCQGFCTNGVLPDGVTCVGGFGQSKFNYCMEISTPKNNCTDLSMPVAYVGSTPYYPRAATESSCLTVGTC